jgi:hypothetical protein
VAQEAKPMTYPMETQARAALRLTAGMHELATTGPRPLTSRRAAFLQVHPNVQAIADRAVYHRSEDGKDPRHGFIAALLRIAQIKPDAFERECSAVDAGERKVLGEAFDFMAGLSGAVTLPRVEVCGPVVPRNERGVGPMRFVACTGETDPAFDLLADLERVVRFGGGVLSDGSLVDSCESEPERMAG